MKTEIPSRTFFRMGDVAKILGVKPHVIRFWETQFPFTAPIKASSGQRVYRRVQIESLILVKHLLYVERFSIEGAKKKLTDFRRLGMLKEVTDSVVQTGSLQVGSVLPKSSLPVFQNIEAALSEIQDLIKNS